MGHARVQPKGEPCAPAGPPLLPIGIRSKPAYAAGLVLIAMLLLTAIRAVRKAPFRPNVSGRRRAWLTSTD